MKRSFLLTGLGGLFVVTTLSAASPDDNWRQWRGPRQDGTAPRANPPVTWNETNNIKWKIQIPGEGSATPIVWEKKIFVQTAVPTGKKGEPATNVSARAEEPGRGAGQDQRRGQGGGRGGGFGPGGPLSGKMVADGDQDKDGKLSRPEFTALADSWFNKLDTEKSGKLDREKFSQAFSDILGPPPGGDAARPDRRDGGPGRFVGGGLFGVADGNKDGTLTLDEFRSTFDGWFTKWDTDKSGQLDAGKIREGLNEAMPRPQFGGGGPGGTGGPGRGRGGSGAKPTEVEQFTLLCIDRDSGKLLWQKVAREEVPHEGAKEGDGSFASPSGLTDGSLVFAYFGSRGLYCYDMNGNQKWSKDLGKMQVAMSFGEGSSPALHKDTLVVNWDNEGGSYIIALDKKTGKELWKKDRDERTSWSTPLIVEHDGKAQAVVAATGKIRAYDVESGEVVWECGGLTRNVIPSPVADGEKVYCASGFMGNALLAIKLGAKGDVSGSDSIAWKYNKSTPYVPSPLLYDGKIYFLASNNGRLSCLDSKDGKVLLDAESISDVPNVYASPLGAGGKVYLVGRNGTTVVLKNTGTLEMLATNKLGEKVDASPVAVGKDLLLRGKQHLYCVRETRAQ
jgi:outer membrane protein assembly factor BamB